MTKAEVGFHGRGTCGTRATARVTESAILLGERANGVGRLVGEGFDAVAGGTLRLGTALRQALAQGPHAAVRAVQAVTTRNYGFAGDRSGVLRRNSARGNSNHGQHQCLQHGTTALVIAAGPHFSRE